MAPEPLGPRVFSRAIRSTPLPSPFRPPTSVAKYNSETKPELWLADLRLACQLGGARGDDRAIIRQLPIFLSDTARRWLEDLPANQIHNWVDLVRVVGLVGPQQVQAEVRRTRGTSASASRSQEKLFGSMLDASRSSALSCRTSLTTTSSWRLSRAPPVETWCGN